MASTVSSENRGQPLRAIAGSPPNLADLPAGCSFAPRCAHASAQCRVERPPMVKKDNTCIACWHPLQNLPVPL